MTDDDVVNIFLNKITKADLVSPRWLIREFAKEYFTNGEITDKERFVMYLTIERGFGYIQLERICLSLAKPLSFQEIDNISRYVERKLFDHQSEDK